MIAQHIRGAAALLWRCDVFCRFLCATYLSLYGQSCVSMPNIALTMLRFIVPADPTRAQKQKQSQVGREQTFSSRRKVHKVALQGPLKALQRVICTMQRQEQEATDISSSIVIFLLLASDGAHARNQENDGRIRCKELNLATVSGRTRIRRLPYCRVQHARGPMKGGKVGYGEGGGSKAQRQGPCTSEAAKKSEKMA